MAGDYKGKKSTLPVLEITVDERNNTISYCISWGIVLGPGWNSKGEAQSFKRGFIKKYREHRMGNGLLYNKNGMNREFGKKRRYRTIIFRPYLKKLTGDLDELK